MAKDQRQVDSGRDTYTGTVSHKQQPTTTTDQGRFNAAQDARRG
jgi:hypothetical protein